MMPIIMPINGKALRSRRTNICGSIKNRIYGITLSNSAKMDRINPAIRIHPP